MEAGLDSMIRWFRFVALAEGTTTLALFFIAMPLKYGWDNPALVPPIGLIHGIAFLAYIATMLLTLPGRGFSTPEWVRTGVAAFVPFGTFINDPMLKRKQTAVESRDRRIRAASRSAG
jgi:integral membrane protein